MTVRSILIPRIRGLRRLQQLFVTAILPRIERHGTIYFRHVRCLTHKEELLAEMRGLAWMWFLRLVRRRKNVLAFVSVLACFAARAVGCGRRVCGQERAGDVLSPVAQRKHDFNVRHLSDCDTGSGSPLAEALRDNTQTPPDEQAQFRCDFPSWRSSRCHRDRCLIDDLMMGERTLTVARGFGLSPARISQLRREFHSDWSRFCGDHDDLVETIGTEV